MAYSIIPLLTGVRNPDQGIMTYQQGYGKRIWLPIWAFLIQGEGKNVLIDTGLDENELFVPETFEKETGLIAKSLVENLEDHGLTPDDIDVVVNTHLHDDHCGNNGLFTRAKFYVHSDELAFCKNPHPLDHRYDEYFIENIVFTTIEEQQFQVLPGLEVLHSPGHTTGCLSVLVDTGEGRVAITGFCCNAENFPENGPAVCPGVHIDAMAAWDSIQKIKEMGVKILPMHELHIKAVSA